MQQFAKAGHSGKCPHCGISSYFNGTPRGAVSWDTGNADFAIESSSCPNCHKLILVLAVTPMSKNVITGPPKRTYIWPPVAARPPLPDDLLQHIVDDYLEAALVLPNSPKASAALSRRCLQNFLRDVAQCKPGDLYKEIDEVMPKVPAYLADQLHAVRTIGNFAAHPAKSTSTGQVVDVEEGEAEWNLEVLDSLFEFFLLQPKQAAARKSALNQKLIASGKKPIP